MQLKNRKSLHTKIVVWSFVPTAIILFVLAFVTVFAAQQVAEFSAQIAANQLAAYMKESSNQLRVMARAMELEVSDDVDLSTAFYKQSYLLRDFGAGVVLLDAEGVVMSALPRRPDIVGQDWSRRMYFRAFSDGFVLDSYDSFVSDVDFSGPGGGEVIGLAEPLFDDLQIMQGVVVGFNPLDLKLGVDDIDFGFLDVVVVDGNGFVIHHYNKARVGRDLSEEFVVQMLLDGESGSMQVRDFEGRKAMVGFYPVPGTSWGVVAQMRWENIVSNSRFYLLLLMSLLVVGVVAPILLVNMGVTRIVMPIVDLSKAAQEVSRGNFGQIIETRTDDEIAELAEQFNCMSQQLQASYMQLEEKVDKRTRELATLNAVTAVASRSLALEEMLSGVLDVILARLEVDFGGIALLDTTAGMLTLNLRAHKGLSADVLAEVRQVSVEEGISGLAVQLGSPVVLDIADYAMQASADRFLPAMRAAGVHVLASTPIMLKGEPLGTLTLGAVRERPFLAQEQSLLFAIGQQLGVAIENARLYERAQQELAERTRAEEELRRSNDARARRNQELLLLNHVIAATTSRLEPMAVLETVARELALSFGLTQAAVALLNKSRSSLEVVAEYIEDGKSALGVHIPVEGNPSTLYVLEHKAPLVVSDAQNAPLLASIHPLMRERGVVSLLLLPLLVRGEVVGTIGIDALNPHEFTRSEIELAESAAAAASQALEHAQAEQKLRESEERLKVAMEAAGLGLWDRNLETGEVVVANYGDDGFKYQGAKSTLDHWQQCVHPDDVDQLAAALEQHLAGETDIFEVEFRIVSDLEPPCEVPDPETVQDAGTWLWGLQRGKVVARDEQGRPLRMTGIQEDITARKRFEEELRQAKEFAEDAQKAAEEANRTKSVFLANMSHELRTPLNAILGFTQLMRRDATITAEQRENLETISRSGRHLLTLINDVLEMSKIEAGRTTLFEQCFDLEKMLSDLESMFHLKSADKGLLLRFERAEDVPTYVRTDESKLRQVLINLLGNAIKFTSEGQVSLRVDFEDSDDETPSLVFAIEDSGPGISVEDLESLFDPFVQTASGRESKEGTGLGLPISRQYVQLMGGDLAVQSSLGVGSLFKFAVRIGLASAEDVLVEQPMRRIVGLAPDQPVYRLLVVEDKWANRKLLTKLLQPLGFEMREAENGLEAIEVWEEWEPHLIWMDMRMPVMDGHQATHHIKSTTKGQATVIVALTASAFEEDRKIILSEGCDDFIRKPFRERDIFDKLIKHLGVRFAYEEDVSLAAARELGNLEDLLSSEDLQELPADWRDAVYQAAVQADADWLLALGRQVAESHAYVAEALQHLVNNFRFDILMSLTAP